MLYESGRYRIFWIFLKKRRKYNKNEGNRICDLTMDRMQEMELVKINNE